MPHPVSHVLRLVLIDVEAPMLAVCASEQGVSVAEFVRRSALTMAVTLRRPAAQEEA